MPKFNELGRKNCKNFPPDLFYLESFCIFVENNDYKSHTLMTCGDIRESKVTTLFKIIVDGMPIVNSDMTYQYIETKLYNYLFHALPSRLGNKVEKELKKKIIEYNQEYFLLDEKINYISNDGSEKKE